MIVICLQHLNASSCQVIKKEGEYGFRFRNHHTGSDMDRFFTVTEKTLKNICRCIIAVMLLCCLASFAFSGKTSFFIAGVTAFVGIAGYICVKTKIYLDKRFWIILFISGVVAKLFVALFIHADIVNDMKRCLSAAQSTLQGDMSWQEDKYFIQYGFQIPFVLYEAFVLKLFNSTTMLYFINALLSIATAILIKQIVSNMVNDEYTSWFISTIYMLLPSTFLRVSVLYNQILGGFFLTLGILIYSSYCRSRKRIAQLFVSGIILGIGSIFRQDVAIVFIAIICTEAFMRLKELLKNTRNCQASKGYMTAVLSLLLFVVGYFCAVKGVDYVLRVFKLAKYGIGNSTPLHTIIQGLSPENAGYYSEKYEILDTETQNMGLLQGIRYIINYISTAENMNIFDWVYFAIRKTYAMWGSVEGAYALLESHSITNIAALTIACMEVPFYCGILGFALYGMKKEYNNEILLFSVCIIGYFIAYAIAEIKPRYRYNPMICLFLLASFGVLRIKKTNTIKRC